MANNNESNNIINTIISQASLVPNLTEKYRCLMVWDTTTNRDVGWLMVKKQDVEGLSPEEVEIKMRRSQWRTWNLTARSNDSSVSSKDEVGSGNLVKNSNEASTSTEDRKYDLKQKDIVQVDCAVQVDDDGINNLKSSEELKLLKESLGEVAETDRSLLNKNVVVEAQVQETMGNEIVKNEMYSIVGKEQKRTLENSQNARKKSKIVSKAISEDSELKSCNVCNAKMLHSDLLIHRQKFHPERFKSDLVLCSGCNVKCKAVDFSSHTCDVLDTDSDSDNSVIFEDIEIPSNIVVTNAEKATPKIVSEVNQGLLGNYSSGSKVCKDCSVVFLDEIIDYHECKIRTSVLLCRLKIKERIDEINSFEEDDDEIQVLDEQSQSICEKCGKSCDTKELHKCEVEIEESQLEKELPKKVEEVVIASAKVIHQPPSILLRGQAFYFSIQLLDCQGNVLHVKDVFLGRCNNYFSVQVVVQLLQSDGSVVLQSLWVSVCSETGMQLQPSADVQKYLIPQQFACRKIGGDLLQFCLSSEYHCIKGARVKLMVSSNQKCLSCTNLMLIQ